jgi:dCMP deaminase
MSSTAPKANYVFIDHIRELLQQTPDNSNHARDDVPDWDEYFHAIAQVVALRSKDEKQVGAVIVGEGGTIVSTGFNGFARGIRETPERKAEQEKLFWVTHAETNAIFNAARSGVSLVGSTLYVTFYPCAGCAQAIVQAGIKRVFTYSEKYWVKVEPDLPNRWEIALDILAEGKVAVSAPILRAIEVEHWNRKVKQEKAAKRGSVAKGSTSRKVVRASPKRVEAALVAKSRKRK